MNKTLPMASGNWAQPWRGGNQPYYDMLLSSVIQEVIKDPGNSKELVKIFAMEFKDLLCTPASERFSLFRRTPQIGRD